MLLLNYSIPSSSDEDAVYMSVEESSWSPLAIIEDALFLLL